MSSDVVSARTRCRVCALRSCEGACLLFAPLACPHHRISHSLINSWNGKYAAPNPYTDPPRTARPSQTRHCACSGEMRDPGIRAGLGNVILRRSAQPDPLTAPTYAGLSARSSPTPVGSGVSLAFILTLNVLDGGDRFYRVPAQGIGIAKDCLN